MDDDSKVLGFSNGSLPFRRADDHADSVCASLRDLDRGIFVELKKPSRIARRDRLRQKLRRRIQVATISARFQKWVKRLQFVNETERKDVYRANELAGIPKGQ